jgi:O-antigen/teichoic acid export membrane protein
VTVADPSDVAVIPGGAEQEPGAASALPATARRSVGRNIASLAGSQSATWVLALIVSITQPRYLGPGGVGQLRVAINLWSIAEVFIAFGFPTLLTIEYARDRAQAASHFRSVLALQSALYLLSYGVVLGFAELAGYSRSVVGIIAIIGVASWFNTLGGTARSALYGLERMDRVAFADVLSRVLYVIAVTSALVLGGRTEVVAVVNVLNGVMNAGLLLLVLHRLAPASGSWRIRAARGLFRKAGAYLLVDATLVLYQQVDVVVISLLLTEKAVGWYGTANVLFGSMLFVPTILMTSVFPVLARLHGQDPDGARRMLQRTFGALLVLAMPIGLGTAVVAEPIATLLYGKAFAKTGPVLAVMGVVLVLVFPTILLGRYAMIAGRQRFWATLMIIAAVASVPLDVVLVPWCEHRFHNGAVAGALSYLVTEGFVLVMAVVKLTPGLIDRAMGRRVFATTMAGLVMVAAAWPLRNRLLVLPIGAGGAAYIIALGLFGVLDEEERSTLRSLSARVRRPIVDRRTVDARPSRKDSHGQPT